MESFARSPSSSAPSILTRLRCQRVDTNEPDLDVDLGADVVDASATCASVPWHRILDAKRVEPYVLLEVLHVWLCEIVAADIDQDEIDEADEDDDVAAAPSPMTLTTPPSLIAPMSADACAISFLLCDARLVWTLYHRYRVKRTLPLTTVQRAWRHRIAAVAREHDEHEQTAKSAASAASLQLADKPLTDSTSTTPISPSSISLSSSSTTSPSPPTSSSSCDSSRHSLFIPSTDSITPSPSIPLDAPAHVPHSCATDARFVPLFGHVECNDPHIYSTAPPWLVARMSEPRFVYTIDALPSTTTTTASVDAPSTSLSPPPPGTTVLVYNVNAPLNTLSSAYSTLHEIVFGRRFAQPLRAPLPPSIRCLVFAERCNFDHAIDAALLPSSLQRITFASESWFDQPLDFRKHDHARVTSPTTAPTYDDDDYATPHLSSLTLAGTMNAPLAPFSLPSSLTHLAFAEASAFDHAIAPGVLPPSLTHLEFGPSAHFNQPWSPSALPASLVRLSLGWSFDQPLGVGVLPSMHLRELDFGHSFNQPIDAGVLPASLERLRFGSAFAHRLRAHVLPAALVHLEFGEYSRYNHAFAPGVLPPTLTSLSFGIGSTFNTSIGVGDLPRTLRRLVFGCSFNQAIAANVLPASLRQLHFGIRYHYKINVEVLPRRLRQLSFGHLSQTLECGVLPVSLRQLIVQNGSAHQRLDSQGVLPGSLRRLVLGSAFNSPIAACALRPCSALRELVFGRFFDQCLPRGVLPSSIRVLSFGDAFNQKLGVLECGLVEPSRAEHSLNEPSVAERGHGRLATIEDDDEDNLCTILPAHLERLRFGAEFDQPIAPGALSRTLRVLEFGKRSRFDHEFDDGVLPPALERLEFGYNAAYNRRFSLRTLPHSLMHLMFGELCRFNRPLEVGVLPPALHTLHLSFAWNHRLVRGVLPASLRRLAFGAWSDFSQMIGVGVLPEEMEWVGLGRESARGLIALGAVPEGCVVEVVESVDSEEVE